MGKEKTKKRKEQVVAFGKDMVDNYTNAVKDDKKNTKVLIVIGIVLCALLMGWWFLGGNKEQDIEKDSADFVAIEDDTGIEDDINVSAYSLHDGKIVGMWGPENYTLEDFDGGSWEAYKFDDNGFVMKAMGENGQIFTEHGEWSTDDKGNVLITWKDSNEEEFFSETMNYEVVKNEGADKVLVMNDNDYFPVKEECVVIFS